MVRLTASQTTHEQWVEENDITYSSSDDSSDEPSQAQDESTYFSCADETPVLDNIPSTTPAKEDILYPVLPELTDISSTPTKGPNNEEGQDVLEIQEATDSEISLPDDEDPSYEPDAETNEDSEDDDIIVDSRRRATVLKTSRASPAKSSFTVAISDDESQDEIATPRKRRESRKPFIPTSTTKLNRNSEWNAESIFTEAESSQFKAHFRQSLCQTPDVRRNQSPLKKQSLLASVRSTRVVSAAASLPSQTADEIDLLSRGLGDLAVDDDHIVDL
ncbi:hypothetical protein ABW20_dc0108605 [Dactylellina cionopaga]|nr:hypothetical protein ABW20_dc0108605 [Dactylellina cionopaga]